MLALMVGLLLQAGPMPTFAAQVEVVGVTVNAVDPRTGAPVVGLTPQDFNIFEDGKRQQVTNFLQEDAPASVIVLLDASFSMEPLIPSIREAAERLIRSLRPIDEVQVASFDDAYQVLSNFTMDHDAAARSLKSLVQGKNTSVHLAMYTATRLLENRHRKDLDRRRVLIILSDGENTVSSMTAEAALDEIRRSSVVCYAVHITRAYEENPRARVLAEQAKHFMESVVFETGGRLVSVQHPYSRDDIVGAFNNISSELGMQYHLGYESIIDPARTGWRTIGVVMTSRSNVRLRYRRGFYVALRR